MNFTKPTCSHKKLEKSFCSIYSCKKCSSTQIVSLLKKKNSDIFYKPLEYCFNYEINMIDLIKSQIKDDEKNFINYKNDLQNLNNQKPKIYDVNDDGSFSSGKDDDEDSSYTSLKSNNENNNDFLQSLNIYYKNRNKIFYHIKNLCKNFNTSKNCFYLTMTLIEQFFKMSEEREINYYQLDLIITAIFILSFKFTDSDSEFYICYKSFNTCFYKGRRHIKSYDLKIAEVQCLDILEYNLNVLTIYDFIKLLLSSGIVLEKESTNINVISKVYSECFKLLEFCFEEKDIMIEHSMSDIAFSIIYLVRKKNNLIYNIEKYFNKIYNIELKKYLNCIRHISSQSFKTEKIYNNLFALNDERKNYLFISQKEFKNDKNNENEKNNEYSDTKKSLKLILKKREDKIEHYLNEGNENNNNISGFKKMNLFLLPKSKSLDNNNIRDIKRAFKEKESNNENNTILFESSIVPKVKNSDKEILTSFKFNPSNSSRNNINSRYKNVSNNSSISTHNNSNNNNEMKNKLYKNSSNFSGQDINKNESKYIYYIKDGIISNYSKNNIKDLNKVRSCKDIFESISNNYNINNNHLKYNKNSFNNFRKSFEMKNDIKHKFLENNDSLAAKQLNYYLKNNNKKNEEDINKEGKRNIFKYVNKMYNNINKDNNIKLPLIRK